MPAPVGVLFLQVARAPFSFPLMSNRPPLFSFSFFSVCWLDKKVILKIKSAEIRFF